MLQLFHIFHYTEKRLVDNGIKNSIDYETGIIFANTGTFSNFKEMLFSKFLVSSLVSKPHIISTVHHGTGL
jgi:hypothetical protein